MSADSSEPKHNIPPVVDEVILTTIALNRTLTMGAAKIDSFDAGDRAEIISFAGGILEEIATRVLRDDNSPYEHVLPRGRRRFGQSRDAVSEVTKFVYRQLVDENRPSILISSQAEGDSLSRQASRILGYDIETRTITHPVEPPLHKLVSRRG